MATVSNSSSQSTTNLLRQQPPTPPRASTHDEDHHQASSCPPYHTHPVTVSIMAHSGSGVDNNNTAEENPLKATSLLTTTTITTTAITPHEVAANKNEEGADYVVSEGHNECPACTTELRPRASSNTTPPQLSDHNDVDELTPSATAASNHAYVRESVVEEEPDVPLDESIPTTTSTPATSLSEQQQCNQQLQKPYEMMVSKRSNRRLKPPLVTILTHCTDDGYEPLTCWPPPTTNEGDVTTTTMMATSNTSIISPSGSILVTSSITAMSSGSSNHSPSWGSVLMKRVFSSSSSSEREDDDDEVKTLQHPSQQQRNFGDEDEDDKDINVVVGDEDAGIVISPDVLSPMMDEMAEELEPLLRRSGRRDALPKTCTWACRLSSWRSTTTSLSITTAGTPSVSLLTNRLAAAITQGVDTTTTTSATAVVVRTKSS